MIAPIAHSIEDAVTCSGIGRTTLYGLIGAKKIAAVKVGSKTLILADSLRQFLLNAPRADIRMGRDKTQPRKAIVH